MKAKVLRIAMVSLLIFGLMSSLSFAAAPEFKLRFGSLANPEDAHGKAMYVFADAVEKLSGGKVVVEVYPSGQLGTQKTTVLNVMQGTVDMCMTAASWLDTLVPYPPIGVFGAGYVFRDLEHVYRVMDGPIAQEMFEDIRQKSSLKVIDIWYLGTRQLNLKKKVGPVRTPEDLKGVMLRMPNTPAWLDLGRALGANPTPLGFGELYMALKTGVVDGQDNPLPTDLAAKFVEVTHYIVLTDHLIDTVYICINDKLWQTMPEEYQTYVKMAARLARYYNNYEKLLGEVELLDIFKKEYGMEIIVPDKDAFRENVKKMYTTKEFDERWGKGAYEKIQAYR